MRWILSTFAQPNHPLPYILVVLIAFDGYIIVNMHSYVHGIMWWLHGIMWLFSYIFIHLILFVYKYRLCYSFYSHILSLFPNTAEFIPSTVLHYVHIGCFIALLIANKCRGGGRNHPLAWRLIEGYGIYLYKGGTQGASNTGREPPAANKNPLAAR